MYMVNKDFSNDKGETILIILYFSKVIVPTIITALL